MFELIFGIIFLGVSLPFFIGMDFTKSPIMLLFLIFPIVGLYFLISGLIKIIKNTMTAAKGVETFAAIQNVYPTSKSINDAPIYIAEFKVYDENTMEAKIIKEEVGIFPSKYPIGAYIKVKYYNNDVNLIKVVSEEEVPENIMRFIKTECAPLDDIIEINGVKYKRIDE